MSTNPYGAHRNLRAIRFFCTAPNAHAVSLVGDFNKWQANAHPMQQSADGVWTTTLDLRHGHHRYAFLVDGVLTLDPRAQGITRDDHGQRVSLVPVS